jgi:hypothetical protein
VTMGQGHDLPTWIKRSDVSTSVEVDDTMLRSVSNLNLR